MSSMNRITMTANKTADVMIYDQIGESWFSDGVTAKGFTQTLADIGEISQINVRINSPGGSVFEGLAIYNALKNHPADVNVSIDGLAASIATVIAMAGDKIDMAENAMFMIHEPSGIAVGTAADMLETAQLLEKISNSAVDVYSSRTGQTAETIRAAMNAETWYSASEAKKAGFVDSISPNKKLTASFDVKQFGKAPEWVQKQLAEIVNLKQEPEQMAEEKPQETPIDINAIKAQAKAEERERQTKIKALCEQAKRPDLAATFCEDESITVADVQAKLFEQLCKANGPLGDEGGTAGDEAPAKDENDGYRAEFKANPLYAKTMSEDEYIAMRRIDDGLDELKTKVD